jgi:parallel beta-helix repeat protein
MGIFYLGESPDEDQPLSRGGGIYNGYYSTPTPTNCSFTGNTASSDGGGMYKHVGSDATATNCTFTGNSAGASAGGICNFNNSPTLTNCILWANSDGGGMDESAQIQGGTPDLEYCCVQGWTGSLGGVGNIGDDPLFKDADGPDGVFGTEDDNPELAAGSPCIDAGDNNAVPPDIADLDSDGNESERIPLDLAGNARFTDDPARVDTGNPAAGYPEIVEMGAYERYEFCGSGAYPYPPGDVSGPDGVRDCFLDFYDFAVWAAHWMEYTGPE